jgi:hypothetical protein
MPDGTFFSHHWYIACNDALDATALGNMIDDKLKGLNDDYAVERKSALKNVILTALPEAVFMDFMKSKGKVGGQHKFPRVLKGSLLAEWQAFISKKQSQKK